MLTLITFPTSFGEPSASPFCVKAIFLLNASGQPWQREDTLDPRRAPRGKLPVLRTPSGLIHDSDAIRNWLEQQGADFDTGLSDRTRATSRAVIRMIEEHMSFHLLLDRWGRDEVWPHIRDTFFHEIPKPLRTLVTGGIRRAVLKGAKAQGLGRMTEEERSARLEQDLQAISALLGDRAFLFADHPTAADASLAPMLSAMRATPVETPLTRRIAGDTQFCAYIDRVQQAMMPE